MRLPTVRTLLTALAFSLPALPAVSGDAARLDLIGYSPDGKVFAFEQYGIQDGSGFPYSEIFAIDLESDSFLKGTPVKVRIDLESAELKDARAKARSDFGDKVSLDFAGDPGVWLVHNPPTEVRESSNSVTFDLHLDMPGAGLRQTLDLVTRIVTPPEMCKDFGYDILAFDLKYTPDIDNPAPVMTHQDGALPQSRACPIGYGIAGIVRSEQEDRPILAIIEVQSVGFEGPDRRYIAVPLDGAK